MAKFNATFDPGEPIMMHGTVKFAYDESGKVTVTLGGYEILITTNVKNVAKIGKTPKVGNLFTARDQLESPTASNHAFSTQAGLPSGIGIATVGTRTLQILAVGSQGQKPLALSHTFIG